MIISKLQQFIIFNCDQQEIDINELLGENINRIHSIQKIGFKNKLLNFNLTQSNVEFSKLTPNTIYLVLTKIGQLGYNIPGATEPIFSCLNNVVVQEYENKFPGFFLKIKKDEEELIIELDDIILKEEDIYISGTAVKFPKSYNSPWNFHITNLSFSKELPSGHYNLKPSSIQQLLNENQNINITYSINLLDKMPVFGITGCQSPLIWDCNKDIDPTTNQSALYGYCSGECPNGYEKVGYSFSLMEFCVPIIDSDSDSDFLLDFDSDGYPIIDDGSDTDISLESDIESDIESDFDSDFDSDYWLDLGLDLNNNYLDGIEFDFSKDYNYNLNLILSINTNIDSMPYPGPELTEIYLINELLKDNTLPPRVRSELLIILEGKQNV